MTEEKDEKMTDRLVEGAREGLVKGLIAETVLNSVAPGASLMLDGGVAGNATATKKLGGLTREVGGVARSAGKNAVAGGVGAVLEDEEQDQEESALDLAEGIGEDVALGIVTRKAMKSIRNGR